MFRRRWVIEVLLAQTIYENSDASEEMEQYSLKAVSSKEEAIRFGELGYEPFDEVDGIRLHRKRLING